MPETNSTRLESLGMKLAVPYNHDRQLIAALEPWATSIAEIFIPAPLDVTGTFRPWNGPDPTEYRVLIPDIVARAGRLGFEVNMAINAPYVPLGDQGRVAEYVRTASDQGVASFTIGDLHLAERVRDLCPDLLLVASATADIGHVMRARHWVRQAGVSRIVPSRSLNKNLVALGHIAALGVEVEIIPNEQCLPSCPYIFQHSMTTGLRDSFDESDFQACSMMCLEMKVQAPWEQWQTEIVPASIPRYAGLTNLIKLAGRDSTTREILNEVDRFTRLESSSALMLTGYVEPADAFDHIVACDRVCERCGWCERRFNEANPAWKSRISGWDHKSPLPRC